MNEKIKEFLQKAAGDEALAAKLEACKSPDEAYALASGVVEGFTKEEFVSAIEKLRAAAGNDAEMSDDDLGKLAGGGVTEIADSFQLSWPGIVTCAWRG